jgi:hypothetical protein
MGGCPQLPFFLSYRFVFWVGVLSYCWSFLKFFMGGCPQLLAVVRYISRQACLDTGCLLRSMFRGRYSMSPDN